MVSKGKKDMSNFKVGDKVRVVGNSAGHEFDFDDIVSLTVKTDGFDGSIQWLACKLDRSVYWYVSESDIEPYVEFDTDSMSEFKFPSGPTVWDKDIGDEGIKKVSSINYNNVSKPAHYNHGDGIECIDYIKQVLGKEGFIAYCRGNLIKYNHRAMYKGNPTEDLAKAEQYLKWVNETLKEIHK